MKTPVRAATIAAAAKVNLKRIVKVLAESRVLEDASQMRRDFPFSFVALPWESNLNN